MLSFKHLVIAAVALSSAQSIAQDKITVLMVKKGEGNFGRMLHGHWDYVKVLRKDLSLSQEQFQKVNGIVAESMRKMQTLDHESADLQRQIKDLQAKRNFEIQKVLAPAQYKKYQAKYSQPPKIHFHVVN